MENKIIKDYAHASGIKLWQVAEALGMHDSNFSKMLRHQLTAEQENEICSIIDKLAANGKEGDSHE